MQARNTCEELDWNPEILRMLEGTDFNLKCIEDKSKDRAWKFYQISNAGALTGNKGDKKIPIF